MRLSYVFLIAAFIELVAGASLLLFYANPIGYMGLIASCCFVLSLPFIDHFSN